MMNFFKYCYYRMYRAYEEKNDSPFLRSLIYISILELFTLAVIYIYAKGIIVRVFNTQELDLEKPLYIWSTAVFILIANYFFYSRLSIAEMEQEFGKRDKLNQSVRLWMLIVFPFIIFLGGIVMYVLLFGGVLFGKQIGGFLQ
jgi:membrane protein insertase Oxa1/YidC/SpoIIIJ